MTAAVDIPTSREAPAALPPGGPAAGRRLVVELIGTFVLTFVAAGGPVIAAVTHHG